MSLTCSCGFGARHELGTFSALWHREHKAHHEATFPDLDQGTRDNLAMFVTSAEGREDVDLSDRGSNERLWRQDDVAESFEDDDAR